MARHNAQLWITIQWWLCLLPQFFCLFFLSLVPIWNEFTQKEKHALPFSRHRLNRIFIGLCFIAIIGTSTAAKANVTYYYSGSYQVTNDPSLGSGLTISLTLSSPIPSGFTGWVGCCDILYSSYKFTSGSLVLDPSSSRFSGGIYFVNGTIAAWSIEAAGYSGGHLKSQWFNAETAPIFSMSYAVYNYAYFSETNTDTWNTYTDNYIWEIINGEFKFTYSPPQPGSWSIGSSQDIQKNFGPPDVSCPPKPCDGNPINAGTGNKYQVETDFVGEGHTGIELRRYYNSQDTTASALGANWHSSWQRGLMIAGNAITVTRADGRQDIFTNNGSVWISDPDVTSTLSAVMNGATQTGWQLVKDDDSLELYTLDGRLSSVTDRAGNVTTLTYDSSNRLSTVTGPFNHTLIFSYNADNLISDVTLPDTSHLAYSYDADQNLTSVTYPDNTVRQYVYNEQVNTAYINQPHALTGIVDENNVRFATYQYDAQGRAVSSEHAGGAEKVSVIYNADGTSSVTDALGNTHGYNLTRQFGLVKITAVTGAPVPNAGGKAFAYDTNGNVTSRMDFNGNQDCHAYDLTRNLELVRVEGLAPGKTCPADPATYTPAAGSAERVILTQWHQKFRLPTQITEPSGVPGVNRVTTFTYDNATGNLLTKTVTAGALTRSWTYTYNSHGQVLTVDGPRTDVVDKTTFTYDPAGNLATITNALNQTSQITSYNANGFPLTLQDPNGLLTQLTYTPRGQVATRLVGQELTTYEYDDAEQLQKITLPDDSYLIYSYNDAHQLTGITDALGNHITYTPDLAGNIVTEEVFDPNQTLVRTKSHVYDEVNRLAQDIGALNQTTVYERDDNGNITDITDPNHNATTRIFDALNRLATSIDPQNGITKLTYNPDDSLATVTDPREVATQYAYDGLGNQISVQSPDSGTTTRTFDAAGNVKTSTDARGITTTNTYDALNRLTKQAFGKNVSVAYAYDQGANGIGHLTTMTDPSGSTILTYDQRGHVLTKKQKVGKTTLTTINTYDAVTGQLTAMTLPSGQVINYQYNANGQPAALLAGATPLISAITYEPFGPAQGWTQGNGAMSHQRRFDLDGNLANIDFSNNSTSSSPGGIEKVGLFRDPGYRITQITDNTVLTKDFGYDALDELISYATTSITQGYTYDANGNRTQLTENTNSTHYTIDLSSNRLLSRNVNNQTLTNYTLDEAGNLTNDGTRSFTIDARGKLASVKIGKTATNYDYNGFGERVQKTSGKAATLFTQDAAGNITGEYDGKGKVIQETLYLGNLPVGVLKAGAIYYVNPDHLGAPRTITDNTGNPVWSWDHEPFGNGQPIVSSAFTYNLRFPGQYYDTETGLHHNGFRDYDPVLGRYIQSDPIGLAGGINTYAYVGGNPVNAIDPIGLIGIAKLSYEARKLLRDIPNKYLPSASDWIQREIKDKSLEKLFEGTMYINGGFALPENWFDLLSSSAWKLITHAHPLEWGADIFWEVMKPKTLGDGTFRQSFPEKSGGMCPIEPEKRCYSLPDGEGVCVQ
jgi:RHS repeat-associated protein